MKKLFLYPVFLYGSLLLTIISGVYSPPTLAQKYHPFPDSNAVWGVIYKSGSSPYWYNDYYHYIINGDTIIGTYSYKKIYKTYFDVFCTNIISWGPHYIGGLRDDTVSRKVYLVPENNTSEKLLYDFNLNVGDTLFPNYNNLFYIPFPVVSVDSVFVNGEYRKRINFHISVVLPNNNPYSFIEGIGGSVGLLNEVQSFEELGVLSCFWQNKNILYIGDSIFTSGTCKIDSDTCYGNK